MQSKATTPEQYLAELPEDRREAMSKLREITLQNLPKGFEEQISYGMLGYVVPVSYTHLDVYTRQSAPL